MKRKVARLSKELNRTDLRSVYDPSGAPTARFAVLRNGMIRPLKMLFLSPLVFILSLYMAVVYGLLYLLFTTITTVYTERYGWAPELCGLAVGLLPSNSTFGKVIKKLTCHTIVHRTWLGILRWSYRRRAHLGCYGRSHDES
jgi:hypothetical protein